MTAQQPTDVTPIDDWNHLLDGRVAVVTGGGAGIGAAVATLFAAHGARVELAEVDPDRAERTRRAIEATGGSVRATRTRRSLWTGGPSRSLYTNGSLRSDNALWPNRTLGSQRTSWPLCSPG